MPNDTESFDDRLDVLWQREQRTESHNGAALDASGVGDDEEEESDEEVDEADEVEPADGDIVRFVGRGAVLA